MEAEIAEAWNSLSLDHRQVCDFVALFSRFEYALKRAGFLKDKLYADPAWEEFAACLDLECAGEERAVDEIRQRASYLIECPPEQQTQKGKRIDWAPIVAPGSSPNIRWLLLAVKTVRNNLFHGGKYPDKAPVEPERDRRLIEESQAVLLACLRLGTRSARDVRTRFSPD